MAPVATFSAGRTAGALESLWINGFAVDRRGRPVARLLGRRRRWWLGRYTEPGLHGHDHGHRGIDDAQVAYTLTVN